MAFSRKLIDGETLTKENFKVPPKELGILPFWFWNGEMNENEMEWQMKEYHAKGIPGLFIHGRFGESIGYLSDKWFERTKFAVEKAKEIGIDVWVYDEMNWPSGTAYRKVSKENKKLRQKYIEMVALPVPGPLFTYLEATDDRYVNTGNSKPIVAYACSEEEFQNGIKNLIDLTPNLSFDAVIPWEAPEGNWRLLYFLEKEIDYYIDALNPESTREFLNETHEKYKKAVGKDFGTVVPGFYTDEPAMHYFRVGMQNQIIPWTSKMFKIFRERRGYDLKPYLPALFLNMGNETAKIRYDFWKTLTEQYSESYYKQISEWCEENNVLFTGHLLGEEWIWMHARCEGNIFKHLKHFHITGVDHLYPIIGSEKTPDQHVAIKIASSAAHHYGSTRLLCESMGGTYWDCSLERMKWIANWEYVLGVTIFNNHGYHYSIEGERKRDWPPSQFYHHTWWKYYDKFTGYMARLGHILSGGKHVAKILMLYPINTAWTNYLPSGPTNLFNLMQNEFNYLTDLLLRLHYDFDYTDEDILSDAEIVNGKIKIRDEEFSVLILPPITHIQSNAFNKIKEFVKSGGKVIADGIIPFELLDDNTNRKNNIKELFGKDPAELLDNLNNGAKFKINHKKSKGDVYVIEGKGLGVLKKEKEFQKLLNQCVTPDVTIENEKVFYLHRVKDNYDIYFIINTIQKPLGKVEISFEKKAKPELWNPNTGEITPLYPYYLKNNRLFIELDFEATESKIVVLKEELDEVQITGTNLIISSFENGIIKGHSFNNSEKPFVKIFEKGKSKKIETDSRKIIPSLKIGKLYEYELEDDNVLCIDKWKMIVEDGGVKKEEAINPNYKDNNWLNVTMGAWEMQLPQERDEENYPVSLWYRIPFECDFIPANIRLLIDGFSGSNYELFINGKEVKDKGRRSKIDAEIKEIDIKEFLIEGKNLITVKLTVVRRTDGLLDLVKLVGDFAVIEKDGKHKIAFKKDKIAIGDWTKQGFPFYSGTINYKTSFELPEKYLNGELVLSAECGEDVLEVIINGSDAKIVPWHPYKLSISDSVKKGKNNIELKITNTLINMLEAVKKPSGLFNEPVINYANKYEIKL